MQTISVPWSANDAVRDYVATGLRTMAAMVRSGYANGENATVAEIEAIIKARFPGQPLGSWAAHCAAMEAKSLRSKVPDGSMVFGGRAQLLRRQKGLISNEEWRQRRHSRSMTIIGDRTRWGNRHFRLSEDGRSCKVEFLGVSVTLRLADMVGKQGRLLRAVAQLAGACQISVQFSLSRTHLSVTFDEMDLRKLPVGKTLEDVKIAEQGASRRGRKRKEASTHYAAKRVKHVVDRPVHPEWRDAVPIVKNRAIGIDLNPEWIGISVVETGPDPRNPDQVRILDHVLHRIAVPIYSDAGNMTAVMANVAAQVISLARSWNCGLVVHEDGLGKLKWTKKSRGAKLQTVNYWSRNALVTSLQRRCKLASIILRPVWGGYSSTIGNLIFDLPDACAAAVEIARRGFALAAGVKDRLPAVPPMVHARRWKDGTAPDPVIKDLEHAACWPTIHRVLKSAQTRHPASSGPLMLLKGSARGRTTKSADALAFGYRRLHPSAQLMVPGSLLQIGDTGYAVDRLGYGKGVSCSARPVLSRTVRDSSDRVANVT